MTAPRSVWLLCVLATAALAQPRSVELERAQDLMGERKYDAALKSLDAAWKRPNLDRDTVLTVLELRGLALASSGKVELAEASFRTLLSLDARRQLSGKYQGKVTVAISAAQQWVAENGSLEVSALEPGTQGQRVKQVGLQVKNDALKLAKSVRFHLRGDGGVWKSVDGTLTNGSAAIDADGEAVDWWAEVLGERSAQLLFLASAGRPVHNVAPAPVAVVADVPKAAPPVRLEPKADTESAPIAVTQQAASVSGVRIAGYALLGAGVVAAGVGTYFGVTSGGLRSGIMADLAAGRSTQADLYARDQRAIMNATLANVFFITAGALGLTGGLLWFLGRSDVQVGAGMGSVSVTGRF